MVRKLFLLLIPFIFIACASDPAPVVTAAPEPPVVVPEPVVVANPKISIDLSKPDSAIVSVSYSADFWAFITGVELKNCAGDTVRYTFKKPFHEVMDNGSCLEICNIFLKDSVGEYYVNTSATKLRGFVAVGDITARPIADNKIFNFYQVVINY